MNGELEFELVPKTKSELKSFIVDHELCITGVVRFKSCWTFV